jgi:hypothetical protein
MADKGGGVLTQNSGATARESMRRRRAELTLDENGTLEGTVRVAYSGHWEADMKNDFDDRSPEEREISVREEVTELLPRAEVTDVQIEHPDDPMMPLFISYHIRVPDYAERTGSRLFLQPAVFQKGAGPLFKNPTREAQIVFRYRWTENDVVLIKMPDGFSLEASEAPASEELGALGRYEVALGTTRQGTTLGYQRTFSIEAIALAPAGYESFRTIFEELHRRDNHLVTLRRETAGGSTAPGE